MAELTLNEKRRIEAYINSLSVKGVEKFDLDSKDVKYNDRIQGKDITVIKGDEEIARSVLVTKLVNEYGYDVSKLEIEHEYTAGRPHTNTSIIDLVVRDNDDNAFLFIELKSPDAYENEDLDEIIKEQLFKVAAMEEAESRKVKYLVLYTIGFSGDDITDECIVIDYEKFHTYAEWEINRDATNTIPERYGKAVKIPYIKGGARDLETNFSNTLLDGLRDDLHNVLWGGGGTDDNDIFSSLTNLILAKIQDEGEKDEGDVYDFQSLSFTDESEDYESLDTLFNRVNELYRRALREKMNISDDAEINKSYVVDTKKFSLEKVKYTVQALEKYSFVEGKNSVSGKDILGDFFEGIIKDGFKQSKGQFFTHVHIVQFMLWAVQADKLAIERIKNDREIPYMIDPSAGSGTFLIEYMKFITENMKYRNGVNVGRRYNKALGASSNVVDKIESDWFYPDNRENRWAREYIYGSELNFNLGTATKVNMILHGDGSTNIFVGAQKGDGLLPFKEYIKATAPNALNEEYKDAVYRKKVNGQFDLVLTNPPFSVDLDNETKKKIAKTFIFGDKKNSENLFLERYYQLLREGGRLAAVLPESVFDTSENKYIRLFLYKYFEIKAVVSLPQLTFAPYTGTKTSILFAKKKSVEDIKQWNILWKKYSKEYEQTKKRVENLLLVQDGKKQKSKLPSIKSLSAEEERALVERYLKDYIQTTDSKLTTIELLAKYRGAISDINTIDKDTSDEFGYVNTWWVFTEVAKELSSSIFMAEVDNIGYKRSKRGEKQTENDLFRVDKNGKIVVDDGVKTTILDYMRELEWN